DRKYCVLNFLIEVVFIDLGLSHFQILLFLFHQGIFTKYLIYFLRNLFFIEGIPSILRSIDDLDCLVFLQDLLWGLHLLRRLLFTNLFVQYGFLLWPPWSFSLECRVICFFFYVTFSVAEDLLEVNHIGTLLVLVT